MWSSDSIISVSQNLLETQNSRPPQTYWIRSAFWQLLRQFECTIKFENFLSTTLCAQSHIWTHTSNTKWPEFNYVQQDLNCYSWEEKKKEKKRKSFIFCLLSELHLPFIFILWFDFYSEWSQLSLSFIVPLPPLNNLTTERYKILFLSLF